MIKKKKKKNKRNEKGKTPSSSCERNIQGTSNFFIQNSLTIAVLKLYLAFLSIGERMEQWWIDDIKIYGDTKFTTWLGVFCLIGGGALKDTYKACFIIVSGLRLSSSQLQQRLETHQGMIVFSCHLEGSSLQPSPWVMWREERVKAE